MTDSGSEGSQPPQFYPRAVNPDSWGEAFDSKKLPKDTTGLG